MPKYNLTVGFDIPCYGRVEFEAADERDALRQAVMIAKGKHPSIDHPTCDPMWDGADATRIVALDEGMQEIACDERPSEFDDEGRRIKPAGGSWSILLLYPDYLATQYGEDTYYAWARCRSKERAIRCVQLRAARANYGVKPEWDTWAERAAEIQRYADDFAVMLVLAGEIEAEDYGIDLPRKVA